jgi:hypothetical protein
MSKSGENIRENFSTDIEKIKNNVAQFDYLFSVNAEAGKKHKSKKKYKSPIALKQK